MSGVPEITDHGGPESPLVVRKRDGTVVEFRPKTEPSDPADDLVRYASYSQDGSSWFEGAKGPRVFHLGFYGYLRLANAYCMRRCGLGIFDLRDVLWRDAYDNQTDVEEFVDQLLRDEHGFDED